jgi:hypothetical protein
LTYNNDKWAIGSDELAITKTSSRAITTTNNSNAANATAITQKYGQQRVGNKHHYVTTPRGQQEPQRVGNVSMAITFGSMLCNTTLEQQT